MLIMLLFKVHAFRRMGLIKWKHIVIYYILYLSIKSWLRAPWIFPWKYHCVPLKALDLSKCFCHVFELEESVRNRKGLYIAETFKSYMIHISELFSSFMLNKIQLRWHCELYCPGHDRIVNGNAVFLQVCPACTDEFYT